MAVLINKISKLFPKRFSVFPGKLFQKFKIKEKDTLEKYPTTYQIIAQTMKSLLSYSVFSINMKAQEARNMSRKKR